MECCTKCDVSKGCSGVAYRDGRCDIFDGTALESFVQGDGTGDDFKVMIYDAQVEQQVGGSLSCTFTIKDASFFLYNTLYRPN